MVIVEITRQEVLEKLNAAPVFFRSIGKKGIKFRVGDIELSMYIDLAGRLVASLPGEQDDFVFCWDKENNIWI